MKKFVLLFSAITLFSTLIFAQHLTLSDVDGAVANQEVKTVSGFATDYMFSSFVWVTNNYSDSLCIKAKKTEISTFENSTNSFCWDVCYSPSVFVSTGYKKIAPAETFKLFSGDFFPNESAGTAVIRYTFFDMNNPNDSVCYIVNFVSNNIPQVIADFESEATSLEMSSIDNGHLDTLSTNFAVINNPLVSGNNSSAKVVKFIRAADGLPGAGFLANFDNGVDLTNNKFVHVKVFKSRISPLHFKLQTGMQADIEVASMYPQTVVNGWEDIVFDFRNTTAVFYQIEFMPDYNEPVNLTDDLTMFFDNIVVNSDSLPSSVPVVPVTFNVNMSYWKTGLNLFNPANDYVDIASDFNDWGNGFNYTLTPDANDSIYSITINTLSAGDSINFKFRINGSWDNSTCEFPNGGPNRAYKVLAGNNVYNSWYNDQVTGINDPKPLSGIQVYPSPAIDYLYVNNLKDVQSIAVYNIVGSKMVTLNNPESSKVRIDVSGFNPGVYFMNINGIFGTIKTIKFVKK